MWSRVKNAAKTIGRGASSLFVQGVNIIKETVNRVVGLPDFIVSLVGIRIRKKLKLKVVILRDEQGSALARPNEVMPSVLYAQHIFQTEANVRIEPVGDDFIETVQYPSPPEALDVRCDFGAWFDDLRVAGDYFGRRQARRMRSTLTGYGAPITAFIVRDVRDKRGCSLGPLVDYVTVDLRGLEDTGGGDNGGDSGPGPGNGDDDRPPPVIESVTVPQPRVLAHELAHACGLWHLSDRDNLAHPSGPGIRLRRWQAAIVRNSRYVTFF
jgi:hypothetical protein